MCWIDIWSLVRARLHTSTLAVCARNHRHVVKAGLSLCDCCWVIPVASNLSLTFKTGLAQLSLWMECLISSFKEKISGRLLTAHNLSTEPYIKTLTIPVSFISHKRKCNMKLVIWSQLVLFVIVLQTESRMITPFFTVFQIWYIITKKCCIL